MENVANTPNYIQDIVDSVNTGFGANLKALPYAIILAIIFYIIHKIVNRIF